MVTTNAVTTNGSSPKGTSCRRWLSVAFFVSLVANLFFAGLVVGRILHPGFLFGGGAYVREFGPMAGRAIQRLIGPLDEADRRAVIDDLKGHSDAFASLNRALRDQRHVLIGLLRADSFDRKAVDDALVELRRRSDAMQSAMETAVADAIQKLPASARKHLAE